MKKKPTSKTRKPASKGGAKGGPKKGKILQSLLKDVLSDAAFVRALEKNPAAALKKRGYPVDPELVAEIEKVDFDVFRRHLGDPSVVFC